MSKQKGCWARAQNRVFPLIILLMIIILYYFLIFMQFMNKKTLSFWECVYLVIAHFLVFMTIWCYLTTYFTDPGKPPVFWGFYLDEPEEKRKRYCLICHIFKPERCHHCSTCNRCVLNMDHHCPWLNSCVGYKNRKFFMMLLFYAWTTILFLIIGSLPHFISIVQKLISMENHDFEAFEETFDLSFDIPFLLLFCGICVFLFIMGMFVKFHIELVSSNATTIEYLEHQRDPKKKLDEYDVGGWYNWMQVFGVNKILYFFPLNLQSGRPIGDGVVFAHKSKIGQNSEYYMQLNQQ